MWKRKSNGRRLFRYAACEKLGLKEGDRLVLLNAPGNFLRELAPIPAGATLATKAAANSRLMLLFCRDTATLRKSLPAAAKKLAADGTLWIAWPKKSSAAFVDLTEDGIRAIALPTHLVDVKVCAVNDTWSKLKLIVRKERRIEWNA
jgi:hypothetical protein